MQPDRIGHHGDPAADNDEQYLPAGQGVQLVAEPREYDPRGHGLGPKLVVEQKEPAGQSVQLVAFPTAYVPEEQGVRTDVEVDEQLYPAGHGKHDVLFAIL